MLGGEADIQLSAADDTFAPWKFSNPWFGTVRGRAGVAINNILFYGTGGLAYGGMRGEMRACRKTARHRLDGRPRHGSRAQPELVGQDRISVHRSRRARLHGHRTDNGLESSLLRFGVNYRF